MKKLLEPLTFRNGSTMKNRFMLAPLTNTQSHADGTLSDEEFNWLTMRAEGGFGLTMTCAAHVQRVGQGFPGQLGIFGDEHIEGLSRLAAGIHEQKSLAVVQLHHAGMRSPADLIGETPVCPSDDKETGARGLSNGEVGQLVEDFVTAALRAERAGFDGVEIHGAHGYILCQFLSGEYNRREDEYGGSLENRARLIDEIIDGIAEKCSSKFLVGLRLSPEKFGIRLADIIELSRRLTREEKIDFLDMSLWDVFKEPEEDYYKGKSLMSHFSVLNRGSVRLGVAGNIRTPKEAEAAMDSGVDWIMLGRAAILHHDFPARYKSDPRFTPVSLPVRAEHLAREGLSPTFIDYMRKREGFVAD
jgi:2,4-dienoyl-CoA reductase-like NADH-dependent reductase (Old Yellow Enzyme family)